MADTLLFRGGNTADVNSASTTVNDREIVIDTETNQVVLGSAKDRTVMADGTTGHVGIGTQNPAANLVIEGKGNTSQVIDARTNAANGDLARLQLW